jgi:hypothetical protein
MQVKWGDGHLTSGPDQQDNGPEDHQREQHRTSDLVLFGLFGEMPFKMVVAHGWSDSMGKYKRLASPRSTSMTLINLEYQQPSVQAEGGLAKNHACDDSAFVGAHPSDHGDNVFVQFPVAQLGQIAVDRQAALALEDEGYFVGA